MGILPDTLTLVGTVFGGNVKRDVETPVSCNSCGLEFSVFGVFASGPCCEKINALSVFTNSLEVCRKRLALTDIGDAASDDDLAVAILGDALRGAVSAFDALGKRLRELRPDVFPERPRNLFQNYSARNTALACQRGKGISDRIGADAALDLLRLLQVRHIFEHNLGVVDRDFVGHVPYQSPLLGKKYPLNREDVDRLVQIIGTLADSIRAEFFS